MLSFIKTFELDLPLLGTLFCLCFLPVGSGSRLWSATVSLLMEQVVTALVRTEAGLGRALTGRQRSLAASFLWANWSEELRFLGI